MNTFVMVIFAHLETAIISFNNFNQFDWTKKPESDDATATKFFLFLTYFFRPQKKLHSIVFC